MVYELITFYVIFVLFTILVAYIDEATAYCVKKGWL